MRFIEGKELCVYFLYVVVRFWLESLGSVVLNTLLQGLFNNLFRKVCMLSLLKLLFITWCLGLTRCTSDDIE